MNKPDDPEDCPIGERPPTSFFKRFLIVLGLCGLLFLLFLSGWIPRLRQQSANDVRANAIDIPKVTIMVMKPESQLIDLVLPSSAEAFHITPLWARTNGYLIQYYVDIGDHVKEGDLLADIDTPEVDQQLDQAIADLNSAIAKMDLAEISKNRWETLYKKNSEAVPGQEVDERRLTYESSKADVVSFRKNVERLRYIQQFKKIYAPFTGTIIKRDVDVGTLITAGSSGSNPQELFQIAEMRVIRFFVDVPQSFVRQIMDNMLADVVIREFPDKVYQGKVVRFAKALDPIARTMRTEVDVENPNGEIFNGLYAEVHFKMKPEKDSFIVPSDALILRADGPQMGVVDQNGIAHIRQIKVGRDFGKTLEVTEGLQDNDHLIINPTEKIREGVKVIVVSERK
ncbi:putative uncharacterized protein [Parachlamydia acanthamoebae UV-7]|jgi:RND family efflux transporter MFP subunit|uniref:Uncharacterized protein n=2 Tax=Parachlamydia acanthamoebae TaxID=83552 RepID=F8KUX2_PARAV|nr:efflux RND transporter periplasmic adaptor subunit [Parachlamydia acanthamoebae]EFB41969.1 hypothetical protein pah_c017o004 [Parachlamydia acanthamoebae str. Hall's coccus]CCB85037.1 putative uncharacterized protein [Parachlamydia acanthamoebae UV-7]